MANAFAWMAWTPPIALFFIGIVLMLTGMAIWQVRSPSIERKGFLPIPTTRGDRLFIGLLSAAYVNLAWAGLTEEQCKTSGRKFTKALFPWAASGRAIANGRDEGFTKLLFDAESHRIIGGGIVGTHAGDLIGEVCLAIEMGCDSVDIGKTIHPHPTLGETVGMAAEVAHGTCTDVPPPRKK